MYDMLQMLPKIVNMTLAASFAGCVVLLLSLIHISEPTRP